MLTAWRLVRVKYANDVVSGAGAARAGGRWNSRGTAMIYTSSSQALAALETLVHLNPRIVLAYKTIAMIFAQELLETVTDAQLPPDWRNEPPPLSTKMIGDHWIREGASAVLAVPSTIVPQELNYLLNPRHRDFTKIRFSKPEDFSFDPRLLV
jgi:RES domain-containing protein